jgi:hypothetical protein
MQNYLKYQNLPLGIIQIYCMVAIGRIIQSIHRIEPVSAYFAFETIEIPKLAFGEDSGFRCL